MILKVYCDPLTVLIGKYSISYHIYTRIMLNAIRRIHHLHMIRYVPVFMISKSGCPLHFLLLNDKHTKLGVHNSHSLKQNWLRHYEGLLFNTIIICQLKSAVSFLPYVLCLMAFWSTGASGDNKDQHEDHVSRGR